MSSFFCEKCGTAILDSEVKNSSFEAVSTGDTYLVRIPNNLDDGFFITFLKGCSSSEEVK